jgi:hypothetical protein
MRQLFKAIKVPILHLQTALWTVNVVTIPRFTNYFGQKFVFNARDKGLRQITFALLK